MSKFNSDVQGVLQGILKEKQPELLWIVNCRDFSILEIETIHELRDILADELIEKDLMNRIILMILVGI